MSINRVIAFNKVKFNTLNTLFENNKFNENDHINMYINIASITNWLYTKHNRNEIVIKDFDVKYSMVYELLNIAMHYRLYFSHFHKMTTSFYFYYSDKSSIDNKMVDPNYNASHEHRREPNNSSFINVNNYINSELEMFSKIIQYFHDCFYIYSNDFEMSLIPLTVYLSNKNKENEYHITLTRDKYEYQLVNFKNSFVLIPDKDNSKLLEKYNLMDHIIPKTSRYNPKYVMSSHFINNVLSITGLDNRNIRGIKGIGPVKILKRLEKYIDINGEIKTINIFNPIEFVDTIFPELDNSTKDRIINNFSILDLKLQVKRCNRKLLVDLILSSMINLRNDKALYKINNDFFNSNVNLDVLYKGVR